jgi:Ser/Thr protein kinase RdoA (MazF antagonist)
MSQIPQPRKPRGSGRMSGTVSPSGFSGQHGASGFAVPSAGLSAPGLSSKSRDERDTFAAGELAIVLSHYNIGVIDTVQPFARGSRRAPKLLLRADTGLYLLKRRARGKDDPFKVAFAHALQLYLAGHKFPLPHLIGTRRDNNSMLQSKGGVYELFEFVKGISYDNSLAATANAGKTLAQFHKLLADYQAEYEPPTGSYHAARSVAASFETIPRTLSQVDPELSNDDNARMREVVNYLRTSYNTAAMKVNELGLPDWPMQIVHSDWHPGNMLFRGADVVAVIDYDSARLQQRVTDIANGALQLSILGGGDDPAQWPEFNDDARYKQFLSAYDQVPGCTISSAELRTIPWLMIEALIAESVVPIATTGSFARMEGIGFLLMVERKVRWLAEQAEHLSQVLEEG